MLKRTKVDFLISAMQSKYDNYKKYLTDSIDYNEEKAILIDEELSIDFYNYLNFNDFILTSGVIISYSMFDLFFNQYCNYVQTLQLNISYKDVKGDNDLDKKRRFLKLTLSIDLSSHISKEWKEINNYRKIRNLIVHHNSNLYFGDLRNKNNPSKQTIEYIKLIKGYDFIELDVEYGKFWIKDILFITDFMETTMNFMKQLGQKIASTHHNI